MKRFLLIIGIAALSTVHAQPSLTGSSINPVVGDVYVMENTNYVNPGNPGANQTWDLTAAVISSASSWNVVTPSSTPYAASFPGSNIAMSDGNGNYVYYNTSASAWQNIGTHVTTPATLYYADPEDLLRYPFTYNDSYSDTWNTTFTSAGFPFYRTGVTTITADGYGTLMLPTGNITDVLRIHVVQDYQDSSQFGIYTYDNDQYIWYVNGIRQVVAGMYTFTTSLSGTSQSGMIYSGAVDIIETAGLNAKVSVFPVPAADVVNVYAQDATVNSMRIVSAIGQEIKTFPDIKFSSRQFNVADLAPGIYFVKIDTDEGILTRRIIISR